MKIKLLKKLRYDGRNEVEILSVTKDSSGTVVAMCYGYLNYKDNRYDNLFMYGDTPEKVRDKAMRIYFEKSMDRIREKYKKYSRRNQIKHENKTSKKDLQKPSK